MTQIEPTNEDIAEALRQMGRLERIIDEALKIGAFTQAELNFARTIAKLRVAREALEAAKQFIENGIEFGFIRMPDAETPDSAHSTLPAIRQVLTQIAQETPRG